MSEIMMRDALLFSDGSFTVFAEGFPAEAIKQERSDADRKETRPEHWTKIVRVQIEVAEIVFSPSGPVAPPSEVERLKAQIADLNRQLDYAKHCGA